MLSQSEMDAQFFSQGLVQQRVMIYALKWQMK